MYIVAVIGQKGGGGKTTAALALAVAATEQGRRTAVIDADPQATASKWSDRREAEFPWVVSTVVARLRQALHQAETNAVDLVFIDTPAKSGTDAVEIARVSDLVIVPIRPEIGDIETLPAVQDILKLAGDPLSMVLINAAPIQGSRHEDTATAAREMGFEVCPVVLFNRVAHGDAKALGQTVVDYMPSSKGAEEAIQLYMYTSKLLEQHRTCHGKAESARART